MDNKVGFCYTNVAMNNKLSTHSDERRGFKLFLLVCVLGTALSAYAISAPAASDALTATLTAWKIVTQDGKENRVPADKVGAGDILEYQAVYRNTTKGTLRNVLATLPIPEHLEFIPGTANPAKVKASIDGKTYASLPLRRRVTVNGTTSVVNVPVAEYRYLRWDISTLQGGASATVRARVKLAR